MISHFAIWFGVLSVVVVFSMSASIAFADGQRAGGNVTGPTTLPSPKPDLTPKAVTKIVVEALRKNDANDTGIKTTFKFASPANQQVTGPVERFIPMVKTPEYAPMVNSKTCEVRELSVDQDTAQELAIIVDSNGNKAYYIFQLSKQSDGDLKDCWMTDGVIRVEPKDAGPRLPDGQKPV